MHTNYRKLLDILDIIKEIEDGDVDGEGIEDKLLEEGDNQQESGEYENSIICYDKAIEVDPKWVSPWLNKGMTYWKLNKYEDAILCYDKQIEFYPNHFSWNDKGNALDKLGRPEEAKECYDKANKIQFTISDS